MSSALRVEMWACCGRRTAFLTWGEGLQGAGERREWIKASNQLEYTTPPPSSSFLKKKGGGRL